VYPQPASRNIDVVTDRYRLAPVREARDREERVQRGNLAAAVESARATEVQVVAAAARVTSATSALAAARTVTTSMAMAIAIARSEQFSARLRHAVELARDEHARAVASHTGQVASLDAARGNLTRARADREVIERHFTRWREDRAKRAERRMD